MPKKLLRKGTKMHGGGPEKQVKKNAGVSDKSGGLTKGDGRSFLGRDPSERGGIPNRGTGQTVKWGNAQ